MRTFRIGGVHPHDNKEFSAHKAITEVALPKQAVVPLAQHIGAPTKPVVAKGDKVLVGQVIAEAGGFMSANVHAPVSGTVAKIDSIVDSYGLPMPAITIDVEGDEWLPEIDRSNDLVKTIKAEPKEIISKIQAAGIVGLGGACFPTHVKLSPPPGSKAECLIINAVECEPFLTCDHQLMLEHGEEIIVGIDIICKALGIDKAYIGIEGNKPDAIEKFQELVKTAVNHVEVVPLKLQYPQGGEKQLIDAVIRRQVPSGALPIATGAVVQNVATVYAVYQAVQKNRPLVDRIMTVTGPSVTKAGNYKVRFGTPLNEVLEAAGGVPEDTGKIICGGPMMGRAMANTNMPAHKRTSGLLLLPESMSTRREPENCMRCGKCIDACPMGLEPYLLSKMGSMRMWDEMEQHNVMDCIECGCCLYTCPSNRPLLDYIRMGKATVGGILRARAAAAKAAAEAAKAEEKK
ncbi:MAG: electron transport complex subunit RsxC [Paludibacteraceae bacterium]|nr:electron transport complex subunit RsxC [Paludibacteraceae bacterium]